MNPPEYKIEEMKVGEQVTLPGVGWEKNAHAKKAYAEARQYQLTCPETQFEICMGADTIELKRIR